MFIQDADLAKAIMVKDFDAFVDRMSPEFYDLMTKINQRADNIMQIQNMFSAQGDKWKNLRKTFSPIFTSGKMRAMMTFVNETSKRLIEELAKVEERGEALEAKSYFGKFSMDTIASCAFGVDSKVYSAEQSIFVDYANRLFKQSFRNIIKRIVSMMPYVGPYIIRFFRLSFAPQKETEFFYDMILQTLQQRKSSKVRRNDLIDMMVDAVKGDLEDEDAFEDEEQFDKDAKLQLEISKKTTLDIEAIVATAIIIMIAGYDTTACTLSFACYELAKHQDVQDRLRDELEEVLEGKEGELDFEDIKKMTYMDQVLAETLRYHNPAAFLQRNANRDYKIPGTNVVVKKNINVLINPVAIHFDAVQCTTRLP